MLTARGLRDSPLFAVTEGAVDDDGLLPAEDVQEIRAWLDGPRRRLPAPGRPW